MADDTNTAEREAFYAWLRTYEDEIGALDDASAWVGFIAGRASLAASAGSEPGPWTGGEEWEQLAWHLCAEENGEESCDELIWEGGPIPEPWGPRWMKYEHEAMRMIELVRKFTRPYPPEGIAGWISVEDRLPEWAARDDTPCFINGKEVPPTLTSETVLVALQGGGVRTDKLTTIEGKSAGWWHTYGERVIAWQKPPAPPLPASEAKEL